MGNIYALFSKSKFKFSTRCANFCGNTALMGIVLVFLTRSRRAFSSIQMNCSLTGPAYETTKDFSISYKHLWIVNEPWMKYGISCNTYSAHTINHHRYTWFTLGSCYYVLTNKSKFTELIQPLVVGCIGNYRTTVGFPSLISPWSCKHMYIKQKNKVKQSIKINIHSKLIVLLLR